MSYDNKEISKDINNNINFELNYDSSIDFQDITVIVPTLNEEEAISLVINDLITQGYENIIVVDGNSTDRTVEIVKNQKIKLIYQKGKGKTGAIKSALDQIETPYFVLMDGDKTYGAEDIEKLFPFITNNHEVIGKRTKGRENISQINRFGNWIINKSFNLIFGTRLEDVCSGMYLLKTEFAKSIPFDTTGFDVEVEIAAYSAYYGSITETPIDYHPRIGTQKLQPFKDGYKIITSIFNIGFMLYPSRVMSLLAISLVFPGLILLSYPFLISFFSYQLSSIILGLILVVIALQGVTLYLVDIKIRNMAKKNNT